MSEANEEVPNKHKLRCKIYYDANRDALIEKKKQYRKLRFDCTCGCSVAKSERMKHLRSMKHQKLTNGTEEIPPKIIRTKNPNAQKEYYLKNKEKYQSRGKLRCATKFQCDCGGKYCLSSKSAHMKTKIHKKFLEIPAEV